MDENCMAGRNHKDPCDKAGAEERKAATGQNRERHFRNRLLALRKFRDVLLCEDDLRHFAELACASITDTMGYHRAWIALAADGRQITSFAAAGFDHGFERLRNRFDTGGLPVCMQEALGCESVVVTPHSEPECARCSLCQEAPAEAELSHRLTHNSVIRGVLAVSTPDALARDDDEHFIFGELAGEVSRALHRIESVTDMREDVRSLRRAQALSLVGSWRLDVGSGRICASDEARRILGTPDTQLSLDSLYAIALPDYQPKLGAAIEAIVGRETCCDLEFDICRPSDNAVRHVRVVAEFAAGQGAATGTIQDVTHLMDAEKKLRSSEAQLRALIESVPSMAVQGYSPDGTTLFWNAASESLYGYSADEAIGQNIVDLIIPPEMREYVVHAIRQMAETGKGIPSAEYMLMRKDGSRVPVFSSHVIVTGQDTMMFCIDFDLTGQKQAEAERARLMSAVEQAGEAFVITDIEANILYVNPAFEAITGYSRDEAVGQNPRILKSGEQDETFYRDMWETLLRGETWRGRMVNQRRDGSRYTEDSVISPVRDASGKTIHYVGTKRDITEHLQTADMLQQAQKMESVGRLAGGVAHDFNNMLNVILGHTEMALDDIASENQLRGNLEEIQAAALRSADLTRQLLGFARKQTVAPVVLDINETVASMLKMLGRLIGENIDLTWKPAAKTEPVYIDPTQVDQLLANLCVNARDAIGRERGKIVIETSLLCLNSAGCASRPGMQPGNYVLLAVSDDGCGMDAETQKSIFEPFYTTKEPGKGTGLGLATVYGIVKQNGGFIDVHSEPGKGASFTIYLPVHEQSTARTGAAESGKAAKALEGETILLVEDERPMLSLGTRVLERLGYVVLPAATPQEAIRLATEQVGPIHALVTDVVMPEMNGRELSKRIQFLYPDIKCLFMSGYSANVIAHEGVLDGGVHFLQKPVTGSRLGEKVREVLDSE